MRFAFLLCLSILAAGCVYVEDGSDWSPDERVEIEPFHSFTLTGSADVEIWVCDCSAAIYTTESAGEVPVASDGHLGLDSGDPVVWGAGGDVVLRTPSLKTVTLNGSGEIRVRGIRTSEFVANNNGSGTIELKGDARTARLRLTGSGPIEADDLQTKITEATTIGSGTIEICAFERAVARIEGSGDVEISCGPDDVESTILGSGDVEMK